MQKYREGECVWCRLNEGKFWPAKIRRVLDRNGELSYQIDYFTEKGNRQTKSNDRRYDVPKHMRPFSNNIQNDIQLYGIQKTPALMKAVAKALKYLGNNNDDVERQFLVVPNARRKPQQDKKKQPKSKRSSSKKDRDQPDPSEPVKKPNQNQPTKKIKAEQADTIESVKDEKVLRLETENMKAHYVVRQHNFSFGQNTQHNIEELLNKSLSEGAMSLVEISKANFFDVSVIKKYAKMLIKMMSTIQPRNQIAIDKLEDSLIDTVKTLVFNPDLAVQNKVQMLNNLLQDPNRYLIAKDKKLIDTLIPSLIHLLAKIIEKQPHLESLYVGIMKWRDEVDGIILRNAICPDVFEWILEKQQAAEIYANQKEIVRKIGKEWLRLSEQQVESFVDLFVLAINKYHITFEKGISYIEAYIKKLKENGVAFENIGLHHFNLMFKFGKNCLN